MKRGGPLKRTKRLDRGKPLDRGDKPLRRRKQMRRTKQQPKPAAEWELEKIVREAWHQAVTRLPCLMCRAFPPTEKQRELFRAEIKRREGHHVVGKRHLKREGVGRIWDRDNGVCLCSFHHGRHERGIQRVPLSLLPQHCLDFAEEVGLMHVLEREYA